MLKLSLHFVEDDQANKGARLKLLRSDKSALKSNLQQVSIIIQDGNTDTALIKMPTISLSKHFPTLKSNDLLGSKVIAAWVTMSSIYSRLLSAFSVGALSLINGWISKFGEWLTVCETIKHNADIWRSNIGLLQSKNLKCDTVKPAFNRLSQASKVRQRRAHMVIHRFCGLNTIGAGVVTAVQA